MERLPLATAAASNQAMNPAPHEVANKGADGPVAGAYADRGRMINRANDGLKTSANSERTAQLGAFAGLFLLPNGGKPSTLAREYWKRVFN